MARLRSLAKPIDRYIALRDLMAADPRAYYALLLSHTEEILPFVYTVRGARKAKQPGAQRRGSLPRGRGRERGRCMRKARAGRTCAVVAATRLILADNPNPNPQLA
jgi:hypothetical protein